MTPYEPYFYYSHDIPTEEALRIFSDMIMVLMTFAIIFAAATFLAAYIIEAIGVNRMAKNRKLKHPALAWVPIARAYVFGEIVDDINGHQHVQSKHRIAWLLVYIFDVLVTILTLIVSFTMVFQLLEQLPYLEDGSYTPQLQQFMSSMMVFSIISMVMGLLAVGATVYQLILSYRIFRDYDPKNKVVYIVLSILVPLALPIILLVISKKKPVTLGGAPYPPPRSNSYGNPYWNQQNQGWNPNFNQGQYPSQNQNPNWNQGQYPDQGWGQGANPNWNQNPNDNQSQYPNQGWSQNPNGNQGRHQAPDQNQDPNHGWDQNDWNR
ncbi:nucleoside recognition domain-containing protein [Candidatus Soleaferrea massiliensis]|uniref:nucleoside recognition domain-containing protein n=1 Tax=Candidatus Soleaferrea massiliensis TaxID=1470354 RepID=UPI00058EFF62|nr:nucleoside recognition domain-containing protein [Candidatus Soleaferrea massiliensis]